MSARPCIPWGPVSSKIALRLALALALVLGAQVTYGAGSRAAAELRALSCCAHDCKHGPARTAAPNRCCGVAPSPGDTASVAPATPDVPAPLLAALGTQLESTFACHSALAPSPHAEARGAPIFLLTRTLRL